MKIAFFTPKFYPSRGGVEKHVEKVSESLFMEGCSVDIFVKCSACRAIEKQPNYDKFSVISYPTLKNFNSKILRNFQYYLMLRRLLKGYDIVHIHDYEIFVSVLFLYRLFHPAKKIFITFHGWEGIFPPTLRSRVYRKLTDKLSNGNICIGEYICDVFGVSRDKISYGAVDVQPSSISLKSHNEKNIDFLFVGRIEKDTGIFEYLDFLSSLGLSCEYSFYICGDGSCKDEIFSLCRKNGIKYEYMGWVEDLSPFYSRSKIVLTSGYLAILEAWANNSIVFSVYNNNLKERYLKSIPKYKTKLLFCSENADLVEDIIGGKNNLLVEKIRFNAHNWALLQTWSNMVGTYRDLWND